MAFVLTVVGLVPAVGLAQGTADQYRRFDSYVDQHRDLVFRDAVVPRWIGQDEKHFWYRVRTGRDTHEFVLVATETGERRLAMDHAILANQLRQASGEPVDAAQIDLRGLTFADDVSECRFRFGGKSWRFALPNGPLKPRGADGELAEMGLRPESRVVRSRNSDERTPIRFENRIDQDLTYFWVMPNGDLRRYGSVAPDQSQQLSTFDGHAWVLKDAEGKARAAFVARTGEPLAVIDQQTVRPEPDRGRQRRRRNSNSVSPDDAYRIAIEQNNVVLVETDSGDRTRLTDDGSEDAPYESRTWWSPDSRQFVVMKTKRGQNRTIHLIESSPKDSIHAKLIEIPYAKPGDKLDHPQPVLFRKPDAWKPHRIDDTDFPNPFNLRDLEWSSDSRSFSFLYNQRGHQRLRLITVDSDSAEPRVTIDESSETFVCYSSKSFLARLDDGNELIWMSERSGWNHLYLIDGASGEINSAITEGEWVVRGVERIDQENRQLYLSVSGIDPDQDPYHVHLIRVNFDGSGLVRLTRGDGHHRWSFSPQEKHFLDTFSRVDLPPVTELRETATGRLICQLEQADASSLRSTGWQPPERFVAKGRDGQTDIYGIIVRPTDFDPAKKYPVLEHIYAGPHGAFVPKTFGLHPSLYEMAQLGFIVVKIDGMGTNHRSKAFHDVCWQNLGDSGFPDRIAWIKQAAKDRPEMDLGRVGIWGGSAGGQSAMRALIAHGDFYHAAVADCGCHDNRVDKIWWNEQWMGWPVGPHYKQQSNATQAQHLRGDLMLIWGELDRNVDPASTMQVIDALVRADKDFEQLIMPGTGHGAAGHPYARRRQADFFIRKLWNKEPRSP